MLLTLSIHHRHATVYVLSDKVCKTVIEGLTPIVKLDIRWLTDLPEGLVVDKNDMDAFRRFLENKSLLCGRVLAEQPDVLFIDCDMIILGSIAIPDGRYKLGVSDQYCRTDIIAKFGKFNAGLIWMSDARIAERWHALSKTSRFVDQAAIEDLYEEYDPTFVFGENYNLQSWRFIVGAESGAIHRKRIQDLHGRLCYRNDPIICIHTHIATTEPHLRTVNELLFNMVKRVAGHHREWLCIQRALAGHWILQRPAQPLRNPWTHSNDSFRELIELVTDTVPDVRLVDVTRFPICTVGDTQRGPAVGLWDFDNMLYPVPFRHRDVPRMLVGNGTETEAKSSDAQNSGISTERWIFWPRHPRQLEAYLVGAGVRGYEERTVKSVYIGNIENAVQARHRTNQNWASAIDDYHLTEGGTGHRKFCHSEYLERLANARYGLALRGYGAKCNREIELMALGTVLLMTPAIDVEWYIEPLMAGIHYLKVSVPEDVQGVIDSTTQAEWERMSMECRAWYGRNAAPSAAWRRTIEAIMYK